MNRTKPIIGLCGGIGAGKSAVAQECERLGAVVVDSDRLSHEVLCRPEVAEMLRRWWGVDIVGSDGLPDRRRIAEIVFNDAGQRRRLESLLHPLIAELREDIITTGIGNPKVRAIILDSPLLLESGLDRLCDVIVFVEAGQARRLQRLQETRGWDVQELQRREQGQMALADKRSRSDYVIRNEGSIEQLCSQTRDVFERILTEYPSNQ